MKSKIALLSDVAVIVVAVLVAFVVVRNYSLTRSEPAPQLRVGDALSEVDSLAPSAIQKKRLLLILKKGCSYCEESTPLYRDLAQLERSGQTDVKMVALFEEPVDIARSLLKAEGINIEVIGGVSLGRLRIAVTPTLVLVDDRSRVIRVWEGLLSRKAEERLKAAIMSAGRT
jgi:thioredoxin-related protein